MYEMQGPQSDHALPRGPAPDPFEPLRATSSSAVGGPRVAPRDRFCGLRRVSFAIDRLPCRCALRSPGAAHQWSRPARRALHLAADGPNSAASLLAILVPVARSPSRAAGLRLALSRSPAASAAMARRLVGPVARSSAAPPPIARRRLPGAVTFGTPALRRSVARCAVVRRSFACGPRCRWREQFLNPRRRARKGFDHAIFEFSVAPQEFRGCPQTPAVVHGFVHRLSTGECTAVGDERPERRSVFLPFAPPRPAGTGGP
jgi:hypothetical protein